MTIMRMPISLQRQAFLVSSIKEFEPVEWQRLIVDKK